jgi:hypothetical protein
MKTYWGSGDIALRILWPSTGWRWVVSFKPRPLYPQGKSTSYSLDRRLGELQSRSGRGGEEKNSQPLPRLEPPIIRPVAQRYTTDLSRLQKKTMETVFGKLLWSASYPMGTGGSFTLGVRRPGREGDYSHPSSAYVKNAWSYTSTPPTCLHGVVLS